MKRNLFIAILALFGSISCKKGSAIEIPKPEEAIDSVITQIVTWGDSLTEGTNKGSYPLFLSKLTNIKVLNRGVSRTNSTQIKNRMIDSAHLHKYPTIIWAGRNNYRKVETVVSDIQTMVKALHHNNYLVLGIINGNYASERKGNIDYNVILNLNEKLSNAFHEHFIDIRPILVNKYKATDENDFNDFKDDIVPSSLRTDDLHLTLDGYRIVADIVAEKSTLLLQRQKDL